MISGSVFNPADFDFDINPYRDLTLDDLSKIIYRHKRRLNDLQRLYQQKRTGISLEYTNTGSYLSTNIKLLSRNIFNMMGYTQNTIYKKEAEILTDKLVDVFKWDQPHGTYSNEMLSLCIVDTILTHYEVEFELLKLIKLFDLDEMYYLRLVESCKRWCKNNYWKN